MSKTPGNNCMKIGKTFHFKISLTSQVDQSHEMRNRPYVLQMYLPVSAACLLMSCLYFIKHAAFDTCYNAT